jgi:hypothetical protein
MMSAQGKKLLVTKAETEFTSSSECVIIRTDEL